VAAAAAATVIIVRCHYILLIECITHFTGKRYLIHRRFTDYFGCSPTPAGAEKQALGGYFC
jgi:hypothetical protein